MTAYERTGWRDEELSKRHKLYGSDAPLTNIDMFWIEYDMRIPVCIIEFKLINALDNREEKEIYDANFDALVNLANMAGLPAFMIFYESKSWNYMVVPGNDIAKKWIPETKLLTETGYIELIYSLRNRTAPEPIIRWLNR